MLSENEFITVCLSVAMSFPATGVESAYRNNLKDVAKMLKSRHDDNYMVRLLMSGCGLSYSSYVGVVWLIIQLLLYRYSICLSGVMIYPDSIIRYWILVGLIILHHH